jgi:hypothetical protein
LHFDDLVARVHSSRLRIGLLYDLDRSLLDIPPALWRTHVATLLKRLLVNNTNLAITGLRNTNSRWLYALVANVALWDFSPNDVRAHTVRTRRCVLARWSHLFILWHRSVFHLYRTTRGLPLSVWALNHLRLCFDISRTGWRHHPLNRFLLIQLRAGRGTHRRLPSNSTLIVWINLHASARRRHRLASIHRCCVILVPILIDNDAAGWWGHKHRRLLTR